MTTNTKPLSAKDTKSLSNLQEQIAGKDFAGILAGLSNKDDENRKKFRTLDFSSLAMYGKDKDGKSIYNGENTQMRRWHQMTLYIQGTPMYNGQDVSNYIISSNLPESVSYTLQSTYDSPLSKFKGTGLANLAAQAISGGQGSGALRASTIKLWNGSNPMQLKLSIPVLDDGWSENNKNGNGFSTDFVESLEVLGSFCLPRFGKKQEGDTNTLQKAISAFSYQAPPNPLAVSIKYKKKDEHGEYTVDDETNLTNTRGKIMCQLGGILLVDNCVLTSMSVEYPNTKAMIKHEYTNGKINNGEKENTSIGTVSYLTPMIAKLNLTLEVPIALTAEDYSDMLWLKRQNRSTSFSINTGKFGGMAIDTLNENFK